MPESKRVYPHVTQISDPQVQQAIRLIFDRLYDIADRQAQAEITIGVQETTLASQASQFTALQRQVLAAQGAAGKETTPVGQAVQQTGSGSQGTGSGGSSGSGLDPQFQVDLGSGCANRGGNGHVAPGSPTNFTTAGMIICGTAAEFPSLLAATVDLPTREANAVELLQRIIWHLQLAGFSAGRQKNPSGAISNDKVTFMVGGVYYAADIFSSYDAFTIPMNIQAILVTPANYQVDGGIPD